MTEQGKYYIEEFKKKCVLEKDMVVLYRKGHITRDEFINTVGKTPEEIKEVREKTKIESTVEEVLHMIVEMQYQMDLNK